MVKEDKKKFAELEKVFHQLSYIFQGIGWGQYFDNLYDLNCKEERIHRGHNEGYKGLSIRSAGMYFTVKHLMEFLDGKKITIKDVLNLRPSYVMAGTLFENYPNEIKKAFAGEARENYKVEIDLEAVRALDYVKLLEQ